MAHRNYVPAISAYATKVAKGITTIREAMPEADLSDQHQSLAVLLDGVKKINAALHALQAEHAAAEAIADSQQQANAYAEKVVPAMQNLRDAVDAMESVTDHGYWPVPTYNDILFYA